MQKLILELATNQPLQTNDWVRTYVGDQSRQVELQIRDNKEPKDLSGWVPEIRFTINGQPVTTTQGFDTTSANSGTIVMTLPESVTSMSGTVRDARIRLTNAAESISTSRFWINIMPTPGFSEKFPQASDEINNALQKLLEVQGLVDQAKEELSGSANQVVKDIIADADQKITQALASKNSDFQAAIDQANQAVQAAQKLLEKIPNDPKYRGPVGAQGPQGLTGGTGPVGPVGPVGPAGLPGKDGKDGTGIQLKGSADSVDKLPPTGNTAGDTYLVKGHMYIWQHGAWQDAGQLQGPKGDTGRSAYQVWLDAGHKGTESDYLASLKGATGPAGIKGDTGATGPAGPAGKSAYQVWLDAGHTGKESDYLASLKGATGPAGKDGAPGSPGKDGTTPDLTPYLKTADADKKYQTATQVQAIVDAKVVPVPDDATATRSSTTNTTVLYLVPEAS